MTRARTLVVDASVVVAALTDTGPVGTWSEQVLLQGPLLAPHLLPVEVTSVLRRAVLSGALSPDAGALAHDQLSSLPVELFPYAPFAARVWELRHGVSAYDACYVALAEALGADLATVDVRLTRAPGPRCAFRAPPGP